MEPYSRQVFYYETDKMAIVHNANYLRIFEEARLDFMKKLGIPYTVIEDAGILIPQTEAWVKYHQTMKYGDDFNVYVTLIEFNGIRMTYEYNLRLAEGNVLIAEGRTTHCFLDEEKMLPVNLKKRFPEAFAKMKEACRKEPAQA